MVVFAAAWLFDVRAERVRVYPSRESARERLPFVAVFAHELKNSLAVLRGYLQLNARTIPAAQQKLLLSEVDRAQLLAEELLDMYVPKPLQKKDVDPVNLLTDVYELMRPYASQAEVHLAFRYQSFKEKVCALDARRVHQALVNVTKNAIEVSPSGGTVTLELRKEGDNIIFSVADEGPGIPEPQRAHVFDPFWSNKAGGTGIGLFLTHRIVAAHGGRSRSKSGTRTARSSISSSPVGHKRLTRPKNPTCTGERRPRICLFEFHAYVLRTTSPIPAGSRLRISSSREAGVGRSPLVSTSFTPEEGR